MRFPRLLPLCAVLLTLAALARAGELAEREMACRSWADVMARAAEARAKEGDDRPLDAEALVREELSDAPPKVLDAMLALAGRSDRERWSPNEARRQVEAACPAWLSPER